MTWRPPEGPWCTSCGTAPATQDWTAPSFTGFATLAGITDDQIVEERFLAFHVVTHVLPGPEGRPGRPARSRSCPDAPGLYLAGDWVGPSGWLSDAAMASGQRAGRLAAGAPAEDRTYPRVA